MSQKSSLRSQKLSKNLKTFQKSENFKEIWNFLKIKKITKNLKLFRKSDFFHDCVLCWLGYNIISWKGLVPKKETSDPPCRTCHPHHDSCLQIAYVFAWRCIQPDFHDKDNISMAGDFKLFEAVLKRLCPLESKKYFRFSPSKKKLFLKKLPISCTPCSKPLKT